MVADVNGDKKADLLANFSDANGPAGVEVILGNGDGTFQNPKTIVSGQQQILFAIADFDHDDKADLVISAARTMQIMLGNGDGTFSMAGSSTLPDGFGATSAWAADVNGDGTPDLIVGSIGPPPVRCGIFSTCFTPRTSVFLSKGRGELQAEQFVIALSPAAIGDFDGDGKIDVVVRINSFFAALRKLSIYPGNGDGTFAQPTTLPDPGSVVATADLSGDELTDLVVLNSANNQVSVMLNSTPAFRMSAFQSTLTLTSAGSVTDDISLTTVNGFSSAIQFSCEVSGPAPAPTCFVSPQGIPAGTNPPTITLTLTAPAQSQLTPALTPSGMRPFYALGLILPLLGLIPGVKRLEGRCVRWCVAIVLGALLLATLACGNSSPRVVPQNQYSVQVTAKSDTLTRTLQVALTAP